MLSLVLLGLVLIIAILFVVNRYIYSWTGLISSKVDLCRYKSVSVLGENGYPKQMSFRFETQYIAGEMSKNDKYMANNNYNGGGAVVSRNFDGVIYELYFQNRGENYEGFNLGTSLDDPKYTFPAVGGEKCTTPSYFLKKNVFIMINDLPLTIEQKEELKKNVWVVHVSTLKLF